MLVQVQTGQMSAVATTLAPTPILPSRWGGPRGPPQQVGGVGVLFPQVRTVSMNSWMNWGRLSGSPGYKVIKKTSDMIDPSPSNSWVLVDEREDSIDEGYFAVDMTGAPDQPQRIKFVNFPASYHNNAAGFMFADGHAEIKKWIDPRTKQLLVRTDEGHWGDHNQGNIRNKDILWLQERATFIKGRR